MSAGWGNSFSLLDEDESGEGVVRVPVKVAAPVAAKPIKEEPKTAHKNVAVADNKESGRKQDGARQERRPPRAREERSGEESGSQQVFTNNNGESQDRGFNRTRGSGERSGGERRERRPDNGAGGAPGAQRAPRVYDRQSGTGRGREQKRGGAGRANWGSNEEEIALEQQTPPPAVDNWAATEAKVSAGDNAEANNTEATPTEPAPAAEPVAPRELTEEEKARIAEREAEAKLMTLDEYFKQKKSLSIKLPEARKAGEGEDEKQWAGFIAAKSDKTAEESGKKTAAVEEKKVNVKKVAVPATLLSFKGEQQRRDSERRESRGPPRDGGFERGPRRDAESAPPRVPRSQARPAAKVEFAATDFPALTV